jgi:peptidylprolyl isomerase
MRSMTSRIPSLALGALLLLSTLSIACAADGSRTTPAKADTPKAAATTAAPAAAPKAAAPTAAPTAAPVAAATPAQPAGNELIVLETSVGDIVIDVYEDKVPKHAANFKKLVQQGYYDGSPFHRVIEGFMAQGGGKWAPGGGVTDVGYSQEKEIVPELKHHRGTVSQAAAQKDSGSQFYICFADAPWLDGGYTVFGEVVSGMENVDKITRGVAGSGAVDREAATVVRRAYLTSKTAG